MNNRRQFQLALTGGVRIANALLSVANSALLARLLGLTEFGQYAFIYSIVLIVAIPASMGLPQLVLRETAYAKRDGAHGRIIGVWRWATLMAIAISFAVFLFAGAVLFIFSDIFPDPRAMLAGLLLVPLIALGNLRSASLRGMGLIVTGQIPELLLRPFFFLIGLAAFKLFPPEQPLGAIDAILINGGAALAAFLVGTAMLIRIIRRFGRQTVEKFGGRAMVLSAMSLGMIAGMTVINNNIDIVMIRGFLTYDDVGMYRPASAIAALSLFGMQIINVVIIPRIASLYRAGDIRALEKMVRKATYAGFAFGVLSLVVIVLFGRLILVHIYGPEFAGGYYPLVILGAAQTVNSSFGASAALMNMSGHENRTLRAIAISVGLNLVLNAILIKIFGINGAALGTLVAVWTYKILLTRDIRNLIGVRTNFF
jgi:O-antigen/teichoic acid export membrane protein